MLPRTPSRSYGSPPEPPSIENARGAHSPAAPVRPGAGGRPRRPMAVSVSVRQARETPGRTGRRRRSRERAWRLSRCGEKKSGQNVVTSWNAVSGNAGNGDFSVMRLNNYASSTSGCNRRYTVSIAETRADPGSHDSRNGRFCWPAIVSNLELSRWCWADGLGIRIPCAV